MIKIPEKITLESYIEICQDLSKIDKENIEEELCNFPATYSYYYGYMTRAKKQLDYYTVELEQLKAAIRLRAREKAVKLTVALGDDIINNSDEVREVNSKILSQEEVYGLLKGICNTLEHKKDMLVQISANRRQEIKLHQ